MSPAFDQSPEQLTELIDRHGMSWVDQYNQHLLLTVQALQTFHAALDRKFPRHGHASGAP